MRKITRRLLFPVAALGAGCATRTKGATQTVTVNADPAAAMCMMTRDTELSPEHGPEQRPPSLKEATMNALRHAACIALVAASFLMSPAYATSFSTDQSDLWYIAEESGWGMQLVQRGSVIFATLFVYDPSGKPTWYTATLQSSGDRVWTGDLYATTGPYFGTVPFDPANVTLTIVGAMTWTAQTVDTGSLNYIVNGVAVTKNVIRQTLVFDNYGGTYLGALHATATGCADPSGNTPPFDDPLATIVVTQNGQSVTITISSAGVTLTISGTLSQSGQFGTVLGTYTASDGELGNASVSAMNVQMNSLTASFLTGSTNNGCQGVGYLAAMRAQQQ